MTVYFCTCLMFLSHPLSWLRPSILSWNIIYEIPEKAEVQYLDNLTKNISNSCLSTVWSVSVSLVSAFAKEQHLFANSWLSACPCFIPGLDRYLCLFLLTRSNVLSWVILRKYQFAMMLKSRSIISKCSSRSSEAERYCRWGSMIRLRGLKLSPNGGARWEFRDSWPGFPVAVGQSMAHLTRCLRAWAVFLSLIKRCIWLKAFHRLWDRGLIQSGKFWLYFLFLLTALCLWPVSICKP